MQVGAELAAGHLGDVDAAIVAAGHHERRPAAEVGEPHAGASVGSGVSQGIEAETQWVIGSAWSLEWRCRGGWAKVAYGRQRSTTRRSSSAMAATNGRASSPSGSPDMRLATAIITSTTRSGSSSTTASQ